jgi:hypothetical protein
VSRIVRIGVECPVCVKGDYDVFNAFLEKFLSNLFPSLFAHFMDFATGKDCSLRFIDNEVSDVAIQLGKNCDGRRRIEQHFDSSFSSGLQNSFDCLKLQFELGDNQIRSRAICPM